MIKVGKNGKEKEEKLNKAKHSKKQIYLKNNRNNYDKGDQFLSKNRIEEKIGKLTILSLKNTDLLNNSQTISFSLDLI